MNGCGSAPRPRPAFICETVQMGGRLRSPIPMKSPVSLAEIRVVESLRGNVWRRRFNAQEEFLAVAGPILIGPWPASATF
jgi:hypothetical protein